MASEFLSGESRTHMLLREREREKLECEIGIWYAIILGWRITCHGLLGDFGDLAYTDNYLAAAAYRVVERISSFRELSRVYDFGSAYWCLEGCRS